MKYKSAQAPNGLKDCIQAVWKLEDDREEYGSKSFRIFADGCPGIIFQHPGKGNFYQEGKQLPVIFLYGTSSRHSSIQFLGQFCAIGVYLRPDALKSIFGLDARELTNGCINLEDLPAGKAFKLSEKLLNAPHKDAQLEILFSYVLAMKNLHHDLHDPSVRFALEKMRRNSGELSIRSLSEELKLSERTVQRKFQEHVGISPKLFSKICQFQSSLRQLRGKDHQRLSDIAFDNLYADQSHFIRNFKEFAGFLPSQYVRKSNEVVDNLSEMLS